MTRSAPHAAKRARPDEVTLATCIGCGAMSLAGTCPSGCADERKLELVPAEELDELAAAVESAEAHVRSLEATVASLAEQSDPRGGYAEEAARAHDVLARDDGTVRRLAELLAQSLEPTVGWWCPQCGGIDAPQPCIGVCIRRPARWTNADRVRELRARAAAVVSRADRLTGVLSVVAHTRPRPGQEHRNWEAVRGRAALAAGLPTHSQGQYKPRSANST